ncbi:uncharacterized protein PG998_012739 [Apiospora kogelbergensis]|uniref:uncharacterized protein n=1 Tax=Apiospora kogelbergensis TaxID=1337665 RepID=UPI00312FC1C3
MSVNITRTSVLEDGILPFPARGPKEMSIPDESETKFARNALRGLNLLQTHFEEPITSTSLTSSLEYIYDHLPSKVQGLMAWLGPDDFDLFPEEVDRSDTEGYQQYLEEHRKSFQGTYETILKNEYYIQQVDTKDNHFVTVILHLTKKYDPNNGEGQNAPFTAVGSSIYVDPDTGDDSRRRVANVRARMAEFLRPVLANIDDRAEHERELWVPRARPADAEWSSGLRAYVLFEQLTRRLVDLFYTGRTYCPEAMWKPTCAWTNLEKARGDMVGAAAQQLRRYMGFTPRVTLSLIKGPKNGKEDPSALVRYKLHTPRDISEYSSGPRVNEGKQETGRSSSESNDSDMETGSLGSVDSDVEEEKDHRLDVEKALIEIVGGDETDNEAEEKQQQQKEKPTLVRASSYDVEMKDVGADDKIDLSGKEEPCDDGRSAASDIHLGDDGETKHEKDEREDDMIIETPVFHGPQWPNEIPRPPSAAARYLANRLDLQPPLQDTPLTLNTGADYFEVNVETPTIVRGEEKEHFAASSPSDIEATIEAEDYSTNNGASPASPNATQDRFVYYTPSPQIFWSDLYLCSSPSQYGGEHDDEQREEFERSDAPSPDSQPRPEAPMGFLSPPTPQSLAEGSAEAPATPMPSPGPGPGPSRPSSPLLTESAKRKLSVEDNYDDYSPTQIEPPAKRQHLSGEEPSPSALAAAEDEYDPALPLLGGLPESQVAPASAAAAGAISRSATVTTETAASQIPGLTLTQEPGVPSPETIVPETQGAQAEGDEQQEETKRSTSGETPSYIV